MLVFKPSTERNFCEAKMTNVEGKIFLPEITIQIWMLFNPCNKNVLIDSFYKFTKRKSTHPKFSILGIIGLLFIIFPL